MGCISTVQIMDDGSVSSAGLCVNNSVLPEETNGNDWMFIPAVLSLSLLPFYLFLFLLVMTPLLPPCSSVSVGLVQSSLLLVLLH